MAVNIVTGASGFVGKRLVQELAKEKKDKVIAVVRNGASDISGIDCLSNVEIVCCEMSDIDLLPERIGDIKADYFFHLAWDGSTGAQRANYELQVKNILWSLDAYRVAERIKCEKFLCAGTISENVLEQVSDLQNISQNMVYAQAKKSLYEFLEIASKNSSVKLVWMQFSNTYGPGNKTGNLISYTLKELAEGRVPEYGPCNQPYNFIYIDDLIDGICCMAHANLKKDKYFIGSDEVWLLKDYLKKIPEILNYDVELGIGKRKDDGIQYDAAWFDISDLKEDTGHRNKFSFEKGLFALEEERRRK